VALWRRIPVQILATHSLRWANQLYACAHWTILKGVVFKCAERPRIQNFLFLLEIPQKKEGRNSKVDYIESKI